jgi:uncharacterized protein (DUF2336 family)
MLIGPRWLATTGPDIRIMSIPSSLIDELEQALVGGSDAQRNDILSRVTDLFLAGAEHYSEGQINLFDGVISKLVTAIEAKSRAKLAKRMADVPNAPTGVIRTLAFDDDIEVARPVLRNSERLGDADLIANANQKSQQHLEAIAERRTLSEAVTDILLERGNQEVARSVARNTGARFSDAGFRMLVQRSAADETLALHVGVRRDLPRQHFLDLLDQASTTVRTRLAAENPAAGKAVDGIINEVVGSIRSETRKVSKQYTAAIATVDTIKRDGKLGESDVYRFAREGRFEETAVALSYLSGVEIDAVERALQERRNEIALIIAKLAGFSSTGAKAILLFKTADRGMSTQDLDTALKAYGKLNVETARRVLGFYRMRLRSHSSDTALAANG